MPSVLHFPPPALLYQSPSPPRRSVSSFTTHRCISAGVHTIKMTTIRLCYTSITPLYIHCCCHISTRLQMEKVKHPVMLEIEMGPMHIQKVKCFQWVQVICIHIHSEMRGRRRGGVPLCRGDSISVCCWVEFTCFYVKLPVAHAENHQSQLIQSEYKSLPRPSQSQFKLKGVNGLQFCCRSNKMLGYKINRSTAGQNLLLSPPPLFTPLSPLGINLPNPH